MKKVAIFVCLMLCFGVQAGGQIPDPVTCLYCPLSSIPEGTTVLSSWCKSQVSKLVQYQNPVFTKLAPQYVYAGGCNDPAPKTEVSTLTIGKNQETSWTISGGVEGGWALGWTVTGHFEVGWTGTWGETTEVSVTMTSVSKGNERIRTEFEVTRTDWSSYFEETKSGFMVCHYIGASPDTGFLVPCPTTTEKIDGKPGITLMAKEKSAVNDCPPPTTITCDK